MKLGNLDLPSEVCRAVGDVLGRIGDKWSMLVIVLLEDGDMRFNELKRQIGTVSQKMLATTLRGLERDGYVTRTVTPSTPPKVSYGLTPLGRDVLGPVRTLANWAVRQRDVVAQARQAYDARAADA